MLSCQRQFVGVTVVSLLPLPLLFALGAQCPPADIRHSADYEHEAFQETRSNEMEHAE